MTQPAARRGRWERLEPDARRAQILLCARRLFAQQRYGAVSMEEIALSAGVRRGLLHHYFGSKRDLYVEVVRDMLTNYGRSFPLEAPGGSFEDIVTAHVGHWLDAVEEDAETWFAIVGAEGFGRDPDVERLVEKARDASVDAIIGTLELPDVAEELPVVLRAYSSFAEGVTREWLQRRSITRAQAEVLLSTTLLALVREVVPAVKALAKLGGKSSGKSKKGQD
jgi:AcrR family transcriptional regulator